MSSSGDPERGNAKRPPSPPRGPPNAPISNGQSLPPPSLATASNGQSRPPPPLGPPNAPISNGQSGPPNVTACNGQSLPPPPLGPPNLRRHIPWLVPLFLIANVVVFIVTMYVNDCPGNRKPTDDKCVWEGLKRFSFQPLRENPLLGPSGKTLEKMGSLQWEKVVHQHQGWRLVSCTWLHAGLIHLVVNMLSLALIGIRLEQQFGFVRIGIIYLMSGFGGSILSALFIQNGSHSIYVGASGAIFGLLGAMLSELLTNWTISPNKVAAFITLITVIAINLVFGILPRVDSFAHIGGFLTGLFLGFILLMRSQMEYHRASKYNGFQLTSLTISLCLLIAGFVAVLMFLYREVNPNDHCKWCHYLSCVPTSNWKCDSDT